MWPIEGYEKGDLTVTYRLWRNFEWLSGSLDLRLASNGEYYLIVTPSKGATPVVMPLGWPDDGFNDFIETMSQIKSVAKKLAKIEPLLEFTRPAKAPITHLEEE